MSIIAENLQYAYGGTPVLRGVDLTVPTGERIGIIGVSGGGKSTLLKLLSGLYAAQTGVVEVHGATTPQAIRRQVAMVLQSAMLFPASIRENITCGHPMAEAVIERACKAAQLADWIAALPDGLDTFVGERGGKVSGGQAQRIAIARAIAKDAPVVLLDEATSALDGATGGAVLAAIDRLTAGKTVVSVSHHPGALVHCTRVYRLEGGRLHHA
ncbi:MAG TPA: ABC transporter ATP-binding protein [Candidatus Limiplasma sp.]|nr:ABC transporter ATP-binding protein [Candidatus Limiplasma sp.]